LVPVACGGGVSSDRVDDPPSTGGVGGTVGVGGGGGSGGSGGAPSAKSLLCSAATIQHEDDVAIWYSNGTAVTFLRHDGTETVVHQAPTDQAYMTAEVAAAGDRIALLAAQTDLASHLYLFDRRANLLATETFSQGIVDLRFGENGLAFTITLNDEYEGRVWDGVNPPRSLGKWLPVAPPDAEGWIPVHHGWSPDAEYGFLAPDGTFVPFLGDDQAVHVVKGRLVSIEKATRTLLIGSPSETKQISLAELAAGDVDAPIIRENREEGWISIQRYAAESELTSLLVVNVETGATTEFPADPGNGQPLSFYCNSGFPGYLTSDGTLLRSHIENGKLEMRLGGELIGFPLSSIASLLLHERAGTVVQVASDGHDTYCGGNENWPPVQDTLAGNSLQIVYEGEPIIGEFSSSFDAPLLDVSGSCALMNQYGGDMYPLSIRDLETKTTRDIVVEDTSLWARWIE
jgi:hypothetical protein